MAIPTRPINTRSAQPAKPANTLSRFSRAREQAQAKVGTSSYYSAEAKARLQAEETILWLHGAVTSEGKFGTRWELHLSEGTEPSDETAILTLACNGYRDELFGSLDFKEGPIGPLVLTKVITRAGQESWDITEHPHPF